MIEEAKMVLSLLQKKGFEAYEIGGKPRNFLHNHFHPENKVEIKDIDIVTNATSEDVKTIFPNSDVRGESFQVVAVKFGGYEFEVATYRKDIYEDDTEHGKKIARPITVVASNLDEDRERRDYTCNAVAQNIEGNYIDYIYTYRNKKISAVDDIKKGVIRAIGNAKQRFKEDPLRILRAFRFMSQLGYEIEKQTLKAIEGSLDLITKIPHERIGQEMNKLILGQNAVDTLKLMKEIGVFDITIHNSIKNTQVPLLPGLKELSDEDLNNLTALNKHADKQSITNIEAWTVLLKPLGTEKAVENLEAIMPCSNDDIEKIEWLIQYFELINSDDLKNSIYDARTGIVKRMKLPCMRDLIKRLCKIHTKIHGPEYKTKSESLIHAFCSRPYFDIQLKITGEDLMKIANEKPGPWIGIAKEKLLKRLINEIKYPKDQAKQLDIATEVVEETLTEIEMKEAGL